MVEEGLDQVILESALSRKSLGGLMLFIRGGLSASLVVFSEVVPTSCRCVRHKWKEKHGCNTSKNAKLLTTYCCPIWLFSLLF